jgi:hypothetical protein
VSEDRLVRGRETDSTVGGEFTGRLEDCQLVKKQLSVDIQPVLMPVRVEASVHADRKIHPLMVFLFSSELRNTEPAVLSFESPTKFSLCGCQPTYREHKSRAIVCIPTVTRDPTAVTASEMVRTFQVSRSI